MFKGTVTKRPVQIQRHRSAQKAREHQDATDIQIKFPLKRKGCQVVVSVLIVL